MKEDEKEEDGKMRVCSTKVKIWIPICHTLVIVLGVSKQTLAAFSNPREL